MSPGYRGPERRRVRRVPIDDVSRLQREANTRLVETSIRAQEEADDAVAARGRAEQEVQDTQARENELRETAELRERLLGIIGHDLRNPLNAIVMASGLQLSRGLLGAHDARLASCIVESGQRMSRMLDQLMKFTQARMGGGFELAWAPCDLGKVCRAIAEEHRIASSHAIHQTSEGNLAGTWDADRVAEAVSNLVGNAVDHAAPGSPVVIHTRDEAEWVVVEVENQGAEIPQHLLASLFTAFRSGDANRGSGSKHLGLGLYIAAEIVRSHGGTIGVVSAHGRTTFTMQLPRARA